MEPSVEDNFVKRRRTHPAEKLTAETVQWLADLPPDVRPQLLQIEFVRISNELSRRWKAPTAFLAHLDDLLIDSRGNRRGFPMAIMLELAALKNYYQTSVHPSPRTVWDEIASRSREK